MITPADFVARWNELREAEPALTEDDNSRLRVADVQAVTDKNISLEDKQFFLEAGLPWSAEPEVWFGGVPKGLPRIWEVYGPPASWSEAAKDKLAHYFVIGSTQDDDPICVDESRGGQIVVLAHDDYFQSCQIVNSSLMQMAEFLLLFNRPWGDNLAQVLQEIDAPAMQENNFWWQAFDDYKHYSNGAT